jgi:DNA polymerase-1
METAYPVAMKFLADAAQAGMEGRDLRTYGGRLVRMWDIEDASGEQRSQAAARGRYARNAMVQGAAAELFKVWAVTVRARGAELGAHIVLCLHDELLVHVPAEQAAATVTLLRDCLAEAAHRWHRSAGVRFVADISVVDSWAGAGLTVCTCAWSDRPTTGGRNSPASGTRSCLRNRRRPQPR